MQTDKNSARQNIRRRLKAMTDREKLKESAEICRLICKQVLGEQIPGEQIPGEQVLANVNFNSRTKEKYFLLFHPLPDEPQIQAAINSLYESGIPIALPLVQGDNILLKAYDPKQLHYGYAGIMEPSSECRDIAPTELAMAFIPGVGFSPDGHRLGRGKGFYDRLLPLLTCPLTGVCFSCQIVESIPTLPHDIPVNNILYPENRICHMKTDEFIPFVSNFSELDKFNTLHLSCIPWKEEFPYAPETLVRIAHNKEAILLRFEVVETGIRAITTTVNGPVWEDSCVEFFVKPENCGHYFNIETNCLGISLAARRKSRTEEVVHLSEDAIARIVRKPSLPPVPIQNDGETSWNVEITIPFDLIGLTAKPEKILCNFYKCGDKVKEPHFLSWAPIHTPTPDFHRPEFFKPLELKW